MIQSAQQENKDQCVVGIQVPPPYDYPKIGEHHIVNNDSVQSLDYNCSFIEELTEEPNFIPKIMVVKASLFDKRKGKPYPQII